jgi:hypothetical protein
MSEQNCINILMYKLMKKRPASPHVRWQPGGSQGSVVQSEIIIVCNIWFWKRRRAGSALWLDAWMVWRAWREWYLEWISTWGKIILCFPRYVAASINVEVLARCTSALGVIGANGLVKRQALWFMDFAARKWLYLDGIWSRVSVQSWQNVGANKGLRPQ